MTGPAAHDNPARRPVDPERPLQSVAEALNREIGKALVRLNDELTVYVFGGEEGRRAVDRLWAERAQQARSQR